MNGVIEMLESERGDAIRKDLLPAKIDSQATRKEPLSWLEIEFGPGGSLAQPDLLKVRADACPKKENVLEPSKYNLERAAEVVENLQYRFNGTLFPKDCDKDLAKRCEDLQKDMKAWCTKVKDGGLTKEQCQCGAEIFVRLAQLMIDPKIMKHAGGVGPADYNYRRALELADASENQETMLAVRRAYSSFLKCNFPSDTGKQAIAAHLDAYIKKNSK